MPIRDPNARRAYHREWMRRRRATFFDGKVCAACGGVDQLELDHVDRTTKLHKGHHAIWSWSQARREAELAKCQVLCRACHREKTRVENQRPRALTREMVAEMRRRAANGAWTTVLARDFGVSRNAVRRAVTGDTWSWLTDPPPVLERVSRRPLRVTGESTSREDAKERAA